MHTRENFLLPPPYSLLGSCHGAGIWLRGLGGKSAAHGQITEHSPLWNHGVEFESEAKNPICACSANYTDFLATFCSCLSIRTEPWFSESYFTAQVHAFVGCDSDRFQVLGQAGWAGYPDLLRSFRIWNWTAASTIRSVRGLRVTESLDWGMWGRGPDSNTLPKYCLAWGGYYGMHFSYNFPQLPISCLTVTAMVFSENEELRGVVGYLAFPQ